MDRADGVVFKILGLSSTSGKKLFLEGISVSGMCQMYRDDSGLHGFFDIWYLF